MAPVKSELTNFVIDLEDEDCPHFDLHLSAYQGDTESLLSALSKVESRSHVNSRIRPFLATPLRLAATAGSAETLQILLNHGANVDLSDVKAQTPLFVALVNQHWECGRLLLEAGADPNGNERNMCTPMSVMAQRGYYEGVKLLCRFGADTEDVYRLMTEMPGLPIAIAATYHHLKCFATLLLYGAKPGLKHVTDLDLPLNVITQCSVPHAIIKYRCPPEFVYLYREFGGNLWIRDSRQRLATDSANSNTPALGLMKDLQEQPLSLQSSCRLSIRGHFPQDRLLELLDEQGLGALSGKVVNFLLFRSFVLSADQIPGLDTPGILSKLERLLTSVMDDLAQSRPLVVQKRVPKFQPAPGFSDSIAKVPEDTLEVVEIQPMEQLDPAAPMAPGPPPPPPPPRVPRPGFWRFPGAELALDHPVWRRPNEHEL